MALALMVVAGPLIAQQPRRVQPTRPAQAGVGFVRGVVYDSLLGAPLPNAGIGLRGTTRRVTADAAGRFRLDSVPAGAAVLTWSHPGLDSAGLSNLSQRVEVEAGRVTFAELTVPSLATLRRAACPAAAGARDSGLILGSVSDAETGERVAGAEVTVRWVTARRGLDGRVQVLRPTLAATTDSLGNYYGCAVSTDLVLTVRARTEGGFSSGVTEALLGRRGIARHDITLSREDVAGARDSSGARRGLAVVAGRVLTGQGLPRPSAVVAIDDAVGVAYADSAGGFVLTGQPSGSHMIMARMVGYSAARRIVELRNRDTLHVDLVVEQVTVLDTLRITATSQVARNELEDLERRMRTGFGYWLTAEEVRDRTSMRSVFQGLPSLTVESTRGNTFWDYRMYTRVGPRNVDVQVWVDGIRTDAVALNSYRPDQILAVEYYPRGTQAPARFQRLAGSDPNGAVLLVWTRFVRW